MATSYANGGQLSASNAEAWNSWDNVKTDFKSFFNNRHILRVIMNPFPSISKLMWLFKFIQNIKNNENYNL